MIDGATLREHLQAVRNRTGEAPARLRDAPKLPEGCTVLWRDFTALRGMAGSDGFGPARIGFHDIDGYQRVLGFRFEPWEITAIRRADSAYIETRAKERAGD